MRKYFVTTYCLPIADVKALIECLLFSSPVITDKFFVQMERKMRNLRVCTSGCWVLFSLRRATVCLRIIDYNNK